VCVTKGGTTAKVGVVARFFTQKEPVGKIVDAEHAQVEKYGRPYVFHFY